MKAEAAKYAIQEEDVLTYAMFPRWRPSSSKSAMPACRVWMPSTRTTPASLTRSDVIGTKPSQSYGCEGFLSCKTFGWIV